MRKSVKNAYLAAFLISTFLFIAGIMIGYLIQKSVTEKTEEKLNKLENKMEDIQLQYIYLNIMDEDDCDFGLMLLDESTKELWDISKELTTFENKLPSEEMETLVNKYFLLSAKAWILNSYISENCEEEFLPMLYFYSVPCEDCERQGMVLDDIQNSELKNKIRVFVMDTNSEEKIIQTIKKTYNITETPTIIIDGEKYEGLIAKEELEEVITQSLSE